MKTSIKSARKEFDTVNLECAHIIAGDTAKYPPDSLMGSWAAAVLKAAERTIVGPLLRAAA